MEELIQQLARIAQALEESNQLQKELIELLRDWHDEWLERNS